MFSYFKQIYVLFNRHPHNAKENMVNSNRMPLIASLLWNENSTIGEVNSIIKRIIALYVNVTAVHYPKDAIQTLSVSLK